MQLHQQSEKFQQNFNNAAYSTAALHRSTRATSIVSSHSKTTKKAKTKEVNKQNRKIDMATSALTTATKTTRSPSVVSRYAPQTYDAVWAIALSLRGAEERWRKDAIQQSKLDRFDYTRSDMASEFLQQMGKLDFLGVSVSLCYNEIKKNTS